VTIAAEEPEPRTFVVHPATPEEQQLAHNMEVFGATAAEISTAIQQHRNMVDFNEVRSAEEADMIAAMRALGKGDNEIRLALDAVRANRSGFRANAGFAFSSERMTRATDSWLSSYTKGALIPEQVARQLRGRPFVDFDEFREAFWIAVANTPELAEQFGLRDLARMRLGYAPIAPPSEHNGRQISYIIHHNLTIARGGRTYDMSNMLIVTPRLHQEILPRSEHFVSPQRRKETKR
jgi:hypothetical protein